MWFPFNWLFIPPWPLTSALLLTSTEWNPAFSSKLFLEAPLESLTLWPFHAKSYLEVNMPASEGRHIPAFKFPPSRAGLNVHKTCTPSCLSLKWSSHLSDQPLFVLVLLSGFQALAWQRSDAWFTRLAQGIPGSSVGTGKTKLPPSHAFLREIQVPIHLF